MSREYNPNHVHTPVYFEVGVKIVIEDQNKNILILKRSEICGGKYSLPGGGVDAGEDIFEACRRECLEELGLNCNPTKIVSILCDNPESIDSKRGMVIVVGCEIEEGEIDLNWEHDSYSWFDIHSALALDLTSHARRILSEVKMD